MWHVIAAFLGGMGLFFVGLRLTGEGVKKIAGRRFRDLFLHCTRSRVAAALLGVASGFVFQSTSGISLILASLIGAGVTTAAAALPVLIGADAGVSCLVLVAVIDINVLILLLLGLSGLVVAFDRPVRLVLESEKPSCPNVKPLAGAIADLVKKLDDCLLDMVAKPLAEHTVAVLAALQDNQALLRAIGDALRQFVEELAAPCQSQAMRRLRFVFLEALEAILLQYGAVFTCAAAEEWDTLARLLSDKSPAMERLREHYLGETHDLPPADRWQVMRVTGLYERCLWLLATLATQQRRFLAETGSRAAVLTCAPSPPPPRP
ncbi:hypothetical protein [Solidesulfovibrio sp.]|uniref:hypothetical protein n=1 Tax=Solidesulfovibrio sp. TaxID=2910990 RepID=UPI002B208C73|nr:hypothetical protein [Solidesulfovibrio sp.]MEA4855789.1 hypothetical protein [Solidesulfovibrio sp.]